MNAISASVEKPTPGRGRSFRPLLEHRQGPTRVATITQGTDTLFERAILSALVAGLGILLAPTSDGGAVSVTVYDGELRLRSYAGSQDEWNDALQAILDLATEKGL
jgi:hypothetical protein